MSYISFVICNPGKLLEVPEEFITEQMCEYVISVQPWMIQVIPEKFLTQKVCEILLITDISYYDYIPDKFITEEMHKTISHYLDMIDIEEEKREENRKIYLC